jgi:hypothetical protein
VVVVGVGVTEEDGGIGFDEEDLARDIVAAEMTKRSSAKMKGGATSGTGVERVTNPDKE